MTSWEFIRLFLGYGVLFLAFVGGLFCLIEAIYTKIKNKKKTEDS